MNKTKKKKKIGIWGFGVVGKSAANYFLANNYTVQVLESKILNKKETAKFADATITFLAQRNLDSFLQNNNKILASPGVDLRPYRHFKHKWLTELDMVQQSFDKPIVAITGSVGKTTVTHLLSQALKAQGLHVWTGGNIGKGMLDLLTTKENIDIAVLEVSSFQLEHCTSFAPDLAIITNLHTNHLDRHGTTEKYFAAKTKIFQYQRADQQTLLPLNINKKITTLKKLKSTVYFFEVDQFSILTLKKRGAQETFFIRNQSVMRHRSGKEVSRSVDTIFQNLPCDTFAQNRLIVAIALDLIAKQRGLKKIKNITNVLSPLPHRLEKVATAQGVDFYNDSKSTTPASTLAAIEQFNDRPIHLLLGGLSKGTSWHELIKEIKRPDIYLYSFGKEATQIAKACHDNNLHCDVHQVLDKAFAAAYNKISPEDIVLLSPGGTSFDLFASYKERGNHFKKLVNFYIKNNERES